VLIGEEVNKYTAAKGVCFNDKANRGVNKILWLAA
jgi:hypothetical protein